MLYLGADHRGFTLKEAIKALLQERKEGFEDAGAEALNPEDDYVDFAISVAEKVSHAPSANRGILVCGSGEGMAIAANKFRGIHAALAWNEAIAKQSREHGDANILVLPADEMSIEEAKKIVKIWLDTAFSGEERHVRRLAKISALEGRL